MRRSVEEGAALDEPGLAAAFDVARAARRRVDARAEERRRPRVEGRAELRGAPAGRGAVGARAGSVRDPYFTMRLYHSRFVQPTGTATPMFWRWQNAEFDALVDQMGQTRPDDPALIPLFRQAMEIWLRELPAIPLLQWFHRIPHNQTYWTNWPSAENPYMNSAYWVRSFLIVLLGLEPAQP